MKIITRTAAIANLTRYIGQDLRSLAAQHGIRTYETGRQNKGWKGLVLERLAGLEASNAKAPNGLTFELKSVSFHYIKGELVPKETMAITMINPAELRAHSFFESHCWAKLKSIVFCAVMWHGTNSAKAELLRVANFDFAETDELIREIEADYEFIRQKLIRSGFESLTGADGKWIQARTKGAGHGNQQGLLRACSAYQKDFRDRRSSRRSQTSGLSSPPRAPRGLTGARWRCAVSRIGPLAGGSRSRVPAPPALC